MAEVLMQRCLAASVDAYLEARSAEPWRWGAVDCCFFAGDWIALRTGLDPLGPYRGAYDSVIGARRLIAARGGLQAMVGIEMDRCGFGCTAVPEHGDIGVVAIAGPRESIAAGAAVVIRSGPWWCGLTADGLCYLDDPHLIAWSLQDRRGSPA